MSLGLTNNYLMGLYVLYTLGDGVLSREDGGSAGRPGNLTPLWQTVKSSGFRLYINFSLIVKSAEEKAVIFLKIDTSAKSFSNFVVFLCWCCLVAQPCLTLLWAPWTVACQAPLSMGFPRHEYWSEVPFPSPRDLPDPGIESMLSCRKLICYKYSSLNPSVKDLVQ